MKNLLYIFVSLSLLIHSNIPRHVQQDYIEIRFTDPEQNSFKQSFFVKKKLEIETIDRYFKETGVEPKSLQKKAKEDFWNYKYNTIITDNKTFSNIISFVDQRLIFFTNNIKKEHSEYAIIVKGKTRHIIYRLQSKFFRDLDGYLRKENCDVIVIKDINSYY